MMIVKFLEKSVERIELAAFVKLTMIVINLGKSVGRIELVALVMVIKIVIMAMSV